MGNPSERMERLIVFYNYSACHRIDSFDILTDFPEFILKRNDYEVDIGRASFVGAGN